MIVISLTGTANTGLFGNSEHVIAVKVHVGQLAEIHFKKVIQNPYDVLAAGYQRYTEIHIFM